MRRLVPTDSGNPRDALPPLWRGTPSAQTQLHLADVGVTHRRVYHVYSGESLADYEHGFAVRLSIRYHHERHRLSLAFGFVASGADRLHREHPRAACEDSCPHLSSHFGAVGMEGGGPGADEALPGSGVHRSLVDAGCVCRDDSRGARPTQVARDDSTG